MDYTRFLTDRNVLLVVNAYLEALDNCDMETKVSLIHDAIGDKKPRDVARESGISLTQVYQYRRPDIAQRQSSIRLEDFVKLMSLMA